MHTLGQLVVASCRGSFTSLSLGSEATTCGSATAALAVKRSFLAVFKGCGRYIAVKIGIILSLLGITQ